MTPATAPKPSPIPTDLNTLLPDRQTPWNVSPDLFNRLKAQASDQPFKLCEVLNSDPETNFFLKYFELQKPAGYSIKRIVCIHNPNHTGLFELALKNMEEECKNPFFAPKGKDEEPRADRAQALSRWEAQASQFSPVEIKSSPSRGVDTCSRAKVLPLWHGSSREVCQSVCSSGFTSFGKHHYFDESAHQGNNKSTDKGYFGSGIYFTNNVQYATLYSEGHLLLSWVSMREPYPVVNDKPHPQKGSDMIKLGGKEHYQNYNAHFIPVASIRPQDPQCLEYYPCYKDQPPAWDEFVVFHTSQTLPRFWVELSGDFPKVVLSDLGNAGELLTLLLNLLNKAEVQQHVALVQMLQAKVDIMLEQAEEHPLGVEDQKFLKLAKRLLPEEEKLNSATVNILLRMGASSSAALPAAVPVKAPPSLSSVGSLAPVLPPAAILAPVLPKTSLKSALPAVAFGKELWDKYLGDVGKEPPLPPYIYQILQSPCPFFPGKRVVDTHLLTLIPKTVNGKLLTLNSLEEFIKHLKQGQAIKYERYSYDIKNQYGDKSLPTSYWALMTRDVIPGSLDKKYEEKVKLLKKLSQQAQVSYEVPRILEATISILMEYLRTGKQLYSKPCTFCQERLSGHPNWPLVVVGFDGSGLTLSSATDRWDWGNDRDNGVGGLRKFF